jgi:hypothetical protein
VFKTLNKIRIHFMWQGIEKEIREKFARVILVQSANPHKIPGFYICHLRSHTGQSKKSLLILSVRFRAVRQGIQVYWSVWIYSQNFCG